MDNVIIQVPTQLARHFLTLSERFGDMLSNAGCNDFIIDDTPDNRLLIDLAGASNCGMTVEEYRTSSEYVKPHEHGEGKLITFDYSIFALFVKAMKDGVEGCPKCGAGLVEMWVGGNDTPRRVEKKCPRCNPVGNLST